MYKFIGHENWRDKLPFPHLLDELVEYNEMSNKEVVVLRGCLFFYETQITTISDVRQHFTDSAIEKLIHDGFLKFKD
jgi:hypothetical protein